MTSSSRQPVITEAMRQMDRAEDVVSQGRTLAKTCFEEQGLPEHARAVALPLKEADKASDLPPFAISEKTNKPDKPKKAKMNESEVVGSCIIAAMVLGLFVALGALLISVSESPASSTPSVPYANEVTNVRWMAATLSTEEVQQLAQGIQPKDVSTDERYGVTPKDYRDLQKLGALTVIDRVGRPEIQWQHVSADVCRALVQDIYQSPSTRGVAVSVDGKDVGVSCAGSDHTLVLSPHL